MVTPSSSVQSLQQLSLASSKVAMSHQASEFLTAEGFINDLPGDALEFLIKAELYHQRDGLPMSPMSAIKVLIQTPLTNFTRSDFKKIHFDGLYDSLILLARYHPTLEHLKLLFQGQDRIIQLANQGLIEPKCAYFDGQPSLDLIAGLFFDLSTLAEFFKSEDAALAFKNSCLSSSDEFTGSLEGLDLSDSIDSLTSITSVPQCLSDSPLDITNLSLIHVLLAKYLQADQQESAIAGQVVTQFLNSRFQNFNRTNEDKILNQRVLFALAHFAQSKTPDLSPARKEWLANLFFHYFNRSTFHYQNQVLSNQFYGKAMSFENHSRCIIEILTLSAHHQRALKGVAEQKIKEILSQVPLKGAFVPTIALMLPKLEHQVWLYNLYPAHACPEREAFERSGELPLALSLSDCPLYYAFLTKGLPLDKCFPGNPRFSVEFWQKLGTIRQSQIRTDRSALLHQIHFFKKRDYHVDVEIKTELRESFIHQLAATGRAFFCLDNATYEHWFNASETLPDFVQKVLDQSGVMIVDESGLSPQAREFLNGVKDNMQLGQCQRETSLQVISLVTPGSKRTTALTSRSIQLKEKDYPVYPRLEPQDPYTFNKMPLVADQMDDAEVLDLSDLDLLQQGLSNLWQAARSSSGVNIKLPVLTALEPSLSIYQFCAYARLTNTPLRKLQLTQTAEVTAFRGDHLGNGYFVSQASFAQVLEAQISLKDGMLKSAATGPLNRSLSGRDAMKFHRIYSFDQLNYKQLKLLHQYEMHKTLPKLEIYQLNREIADLSGLKTYDVRQELSGLPLKQQVSLWYTPGSINVQSFNRFDLNVRNCIWLHSEDLYTRLNYEILPLREVGGIQRYLAVEGYLRKLLKLPEIASGKQPLFIFGLEDYPELQQTFLSLFVKDPYLSTFGSMDFLNKLAPKARIVFVVSKPLDYLPVSHYSGRLISSSGLLEVQYPEAWQGFSTLTPEQQSAWLPAEAGRIKSRHDTFKALSVAYLDPKQRGIAVLGGLSCGKRSLIDAVVNAAEDKAYTLDAGLWGQPQFFKTIYQWATANNGQVRLPLIVENATTRTDWSMFREVFVERPSIRVNGQSMPLSPQHLLIIKGHLPSEARCHYLPLFADNAFCIQVPAITHAEHASMIVNPILNTIDFTNPAMKTHLRDKLLLLQQGAEAILGQNRVTARQLELITLQLVALLARSIDHKDLSIEDANMYQSVGLAMHGLIRSQYKSRAANEDQAALFQSFVLKNLEFEYLKYRVVPIKSFVNHMASTASTQLILENLHLGYELRRDLLPSLQKSTPASFFYPQVYIVSGQPGIGKDAAVSAFFKQTGKEYMHFNATQDLDWTLKQIQRAAESGIPVIVSEADLMAGLFEGLVAGVLQGSLMNGKPVHPGFMLILTVNGIALAGREPFSASFLNKAVLIQASELDDHDVSLLGNFYMNRGECLIENDILNQDERLRHYYPDIDRQLDMIPPRVINKMMIEMSQYTPVDTVRRWFDLDQYATVSLDRQKKSEPSASQVTSAVPIKSLTEKELQASKRQYKIHWVTPTPNQVAQQAPSAPTAKPKFGLAALHSDFSAPAPIGNPDKIPIVGQVQNLFTDEKMTRLSKLLLQDAMDSNGQINSFRDADLPRLSLNTSFKSNLRFFVSLDSGKSLTIQRKAHIGFKLPLPIYFAPLSETLRLLVKAGQTGFMVKGTLHMDEANSVYGIFNRGDIEVQMKILEAQNKGPVETLLEYEFAPVIEPEKPLKRVKVNKKAVKPAYDQKLFEQLPAEIRQSVERINKAIQDNINVKSVIEVEIKNHAQTCFYPKIEDKALEMEYEQFKKAPNGQSQDRALTYFKLRRGQCTHAADAWSWLLNRFTAANAYLMRGYFNTAENAKPFNLRAGHRWIGVDINNRIEQFDPTPRVMTTEKFIPPNQDDEKQAFEEAKRAQAKIQAQSEKEKSVSKSDIKGKRSVQAPVAEEVKNLYIAPQTLDFLYKREQRLFTFSPDERLVFEQLLPPLLKRLEQPVMGKGIRYATSGHILAPSRVVSNSKRIFASSYATTQTGYKNLVFKEFHANPTLILLQPMLIQALLNAGISIYAPVGQQQEFKEIRSAQDLFERKKFKNEIIPAQLQGENTHFIDQKELDALVQKMVSALTKVYAKQKWSPDTMVADLTSRHFRGWMLKLFAEVHASMEKTVTQFNPKKPIKTLPLNIAGIKPDVEKVLKMAGVNEV